MKKKYFNPEFEVTELKINENLLLGPGGDIGLSEEDPDMEWE